MDTANPATQRKTCVTIGNFDGAHLGHQFLIRLAAARAHAGSLDLTAVTFWPHPREIIKGPGTHMPLTSRARRMAYLRDLGIDRIVEITFTPELAALDPDAFVKKHLLPLNMAELVIGHDFALGRGKAGNAQMLGELARKYGFALSQAAQFKLDGQPVSSTIIRHHLKSGNVEEATRLLGRLHTVCGKVTHGYGRGGKIGFPTANLAAPDALVPGHGVYASFAVCQGRSYEAVTNIGCNPTFGNSEQTIETFLLDTDANLYGKEICLQFAAFLRSERKFASPAELAAQIETDVAASRAILARLSNS